MGVLAQPSPGGTDMNEIIGAISALKTTVDLMSMAVAARDNAKIQAAQMTLTEQTSRALDMAISQLQAKHAIELEAQKLRTELVEANARTQELERQLERRRMYTLAQPAPGKWAYTHLDTQPGPPETTAYFCAACYATQREVPLQFKKAGPGQDAYLSCSVEPKHSLNLGGATPEPPAPRINYPQTRW